MTESVSAASALPGFRRWRRLSNRWCASLSLRILLLPPPLPPHRRSSFLGSKHVVLGRNRSPGRRGGCSHLEMAAHCRLEAGATSLKINKLTRVVVVFQSRISFIHYTSI